jgi:hypothetical protein
MRKLFLLCIVVLTLTEIASAKIMSKLSDGTVLQFPDGTSSSVIQDVTNRVIKERKASGTTKIKQSQPWDRSEKEPWVKDALVLTFNSKGEREYTPEELGLKTKEQESNLPEGYKLEKRGQSPDEWLASQNKANEKSFASKVAGLFGPTNAAECVQKYAPKLKFSDALNLIYRACAIGHSNGLDSKLVSASKCIINKTDDIYSNESGLKIINNCVKDIPYAFGYFSNSLNEAQEARVSEKITNQINAQSRNRNNLEESQTRFFQIYDSTTQQYKNCYGTGSLISCQ